MIADIILVSAGIIALLFASAADIKSKEIPDWLNFSLLATALGVRLIYSMSSADWGYFFWGLAGASAMFLLGCLLYYTRQWGGGDTKLITALGAVFATRPYFVSGQLPFLSSILINILIVGSIYGLIWTFYIYVNNFKVVNSEAIKLIKEHRLSRLILILFGLLLGVVAYFIPSRQFSMMLFLLAGMVVAYSFLLYFVKAVEAISMFKRVPVRKLVEGDWVAESVRIRGKVICGPKDNGISKEQISLLRKAKFKDVLVKEGIPFVPSFLIAVILTLIFDNLIFVFV